MMPDDEDRKPEPGEAPMPWEDVVAETQKLFAEAHAAGAGSAPEALPELPPDEDVTASSEASARLMDEAFGRQVDANTELAEYRRTGRQPQ